jgi:hypothetical protein
VLPRPSLVIVASSGPAAVRRERRWGTVAAGPGLSKPGPEGAAYVPQAATAAGYPKRDDELYPGHLHQVAA